MSVAELKTALMQKTGFQTLDTNASEGQIRILGRVPPNASNQWVLVLQRLLHDSERMQWKLDASKKYFLRDQDHKMIYAWRLIFQAPAMNNQIASIIESLMNSPKPNRVEISEFPLAGARTHNANGKGATNIMGDGGVPEILSRKLGR